jgi:hypothetical protein
MIDLKKSKPYTFTKHLLNSAMALVLVLLPMFWFDFIGLESLILILGITIVLYPMHRKIDKDRQIAESEQA